MMRALYSGISGLKVHQSKMDVIGNNISNVNTVGFKASQVTFSDILYQTTSAASGPNAENGRAGVNAKQIGLGANFASVKTTMDATGGSQRTDNPLDMMIEGDGFFIVGNGSQKLFTKAGSFTVDAEGTLCTATGYPVLGWQVDPNDPTKIMADTVSSLHVMSAENMYSEPEATTNAHFTGNIDSSDVALTGTGRMTNFTFYDQLGQSYTVQMRVNQVDEQGSLIKANYEMSVTDVLDASGNSIFAYETIENGAKVYKPSNIPSVYFMTGVTSKDNNNDDVTNYVTYNFKCTGVDPVTGKPTVVLDTDTSSATSTPAVPAGAPVTDLDANPKVVSTGSIDLPRLIFDPSRGSVVEVGSSHAAAEQRTSMMTFNIVTQYTDNTVTPAVDKTVPNAFREKGIDVDFSKMTMYANSGKTTMEGNKGDLQNNGKGRTAGKMSGLTADNSGKIYGVYDNGVSKLLGQVVVAKFPNNSGLEAVGNSLFAETQNSGEFDGIGEDITASGGKFNIGVLESSNVDLSNEFTDMITTQRGFQANSRIITVSDTLLEELVNLKR